MSRQDLIEHRIGIASEVRVVLSAYFQPHESDEIKTAQLAWWCDELQDWTREQVVWSLREWNRKNPRSRPTPGDILAICKEARGRKEAAKMAESAKAALPKMEERRAPLTEEQRTERMRVSAEILRDFAMPEAGDG